MESSLRLRYAAPANVLFDGIKSWPSRMTLILLSFHAWVDMSTLLQGLTTYECSLIWSNV